MNEFGTTVDSAAESVLSDLVDEITQRLNHGETFSIDEYAQRHPALADTLRAVYATLLRVRSVGQSDSCPNCEIGTDVDSLGQLGDYRLLREIGRGGMGIVYEAIQVSLQRHVALKVLPFVAVLDVRALQRFKNEAQAAASLRHPHIVGVHSIGCERGVHYYAMDLIEGQSLAQIINQLPPRRQARARGSPAAADHSSPDQAHAVLVPATDQPETPTQPIAELSTAYDRQPAEYFRTAARLVIQAASALDYAHHTGLVHRDIKPSNLLVDNEGSLWVTDFGLATTRREGNLTLTGDLVGTARYMSPEQGSGRRVVLDHRTDIYSLGITLYEIVTGQPAFPGDDHQLILRQVFEQEPRPPRDIDPGIPADLETIILKATAKDPSARYESAQELADDLERFLQHKPIRARRSGRLERWWRWVKRNPTTATLLCMVSVLLTILAVGGTAFAVRQTLLANALDAELRDRRSLERKLNRAFRQTGVILKSMQPEQSHLREDMLLFYESLLESEAHDPTVQFEAATAFYELGRVFRQCGSRPRGTALVQKACDLLDGLVSKHPSEPRYRLQLARAHYVLGDPRRSIELAQRLVKEDTSKVEYYRILADSQCYYGLGLEQAGRPVAAEREIRLGVKTWQSAVRMSGGQDQDWAGLAWSRSLLGNFCLRRGRFDEAQHEVVTAVEMAEKVDASVWRNPFYMSGLARGYVRHGQLLMCMQRPEEAERSARKAIACAEDVLRVSRDYMNGRRALAGAYGLLGDALLCMRRGDEAERAKRKAVEHWHQLVNDVPSEASYRLESAWSTYQLGEVLWRVQRHHEARSLFRQARVRLEAAPDREDPQWRRCLAKMLIVCPDRQSRDPNRGVKLARDTLQPEIGSSWQLLGAAYYRVGQWQQAIDALTRCMELTEGGDAISWLLLAMAHWQQGNHALTLRWKERASEAIELEKPILFQNYSHPNCLCDLRNEAEALIMESNSATH